MVSVNYRLSGEALFPAAVQDVKAAVRWLRAQRPSTGWMPRRVAAVGDSAGGNLAAMLATSGRGRAVRRHECSATPAQSSAVQAAVDWFGPIDFFTHGRPAGGERTAL